MSGGEDGSGAERHRGHCADGHRQHHGALGAPPLLHHKGHISSDLCVCVLNLMAICSIMVLWGHLFVFVFVFVFVEQHGALGAPPLLHHQGHNSSLAAFVCRQNTSLQRKYLFTRTQSFVFLQAQVPWLS